MSEASPVFIHSIFRAGSTYVFSAFRRSSTGYWCYQEPLHELAYCCRENPVGLDADHGGDKVALLRHPPLDGSYFKELKEVWPAWKDTISAGIIYNDYFAACDEKFNKAYWQSLIDAAPSRPVFQECRTAGRIAAIKAGLGGTHLYLWRNPWDQWWSYKVAPYFDATSRLVVHARNAPKAAELLAASLGLSVYPGSEEDIAAAFAYYSERPLSSDHSYQLFYLLWCLALHEGLQHADLMLNIDQLSDSADYRKEALAALQCLGITGVDFSDCVSPQAMYSETERAWFVVQEAKVHACLLEGGWRLGNLERLQSVRHQQQPLLWKSDSPGRLGEQGSRARELARRFETSMAERLHLGHLRQTAIEEELGAARQALHQAELEVQRSSGQLRQMEIEFGQARTDALVLQARLEERASAADARASQAEQQVAKAEALNLELSNALELARAEMLQAQVAMQAQQVRFDERESEQQARLAGLEQQLAAALTDNHYHWQLANERAEEIARVSGLYDQVSQALQASEGARSGLAAERDQKSGEIQYWHQCVLDLHASTSWRLTKPLRGLKRLVNGEAGVRKSAGSSIGSGEILRSGGQTLVAHGIRYVFMRPRLRRCLSAGLKAAPWLHRKLLQIGVRTGVVSSLVPSAGGLQVIGAAPSAKCAKNIRYAGKKIAVLVPGAANGVLGGAERFYSGLVKALSDMGCQADTVCLPVDESCFEGIKQGYKDFASLDLSAYDMVISTKAPTYVASHPNHVLYLVHTVRVFYDMFDDVFPQPSAELLAQREWIKQADTAAFLRIAKRFSIGAEVSQRLQHWNGVGAEVLHPPMDLYGLYDSGIGDYFFMPGRLHPWKRVDLAIKAVKGSGLPLRLLISGVGEAEQTLRDLAGGDDRIEFLGRVDDEKLKALYAGALAVPFLPLREDYGYVTLEAFSSGKPVVTCSDSGEPNQFVQDGVTGVVCSPDEDAVRAAFERLWNDREFAKRLGEAGRERIKNIRWPAVADCLLEAGFEGDQNPERKAKNPLKVAVLDMQPIIPAVGGGRIRLLGLYHALGLNTETRYVGTYDWPGEKFRRHQVTPTLEEVDVPLSEAHHRAAAEAARKAGGKVVIDMLFGQQAHLSPAYIEEAVRAIYWADVVVFSHPWVAPLVSDEVLKDKVVVYDSQNVEGRLRAQILDQSDPFQKSVLDEVKRAEKLVGDRADLILTCSEEDSEGFVQDYGWNKAAMIVAPNGVFCEAIEPPTQEQKADARDRLGICAAVSGVAFFIGSDYAPNVEAANIVIQLIAPACPRVQFVIAGGVSARVDAAGVSNVNLVGFVDDFQRLLWLRAADFAINPMCSGSGTNIKMFDFMAAGLPVVSTPVGARGIVDASTTGICLAECEDMPAAISALLESPEALALAGIENRRLVEKSFSWENISPRLGKQLRSAWLRRKGRDSLDAGRGGTPRRIAHVTTLGTKCGIGEYTKKIVDTFNNKGLKNFVVSCNSAQESATPYPSADRFHVGWYFDNKHWVDSHIKPDVIKMVLDWGAQGVLIQYHPGFYSSATLLEFAKGCVLKGMSTAVVVHNYTGCSPAALSELNRSGVTLFSHREEEVLEAEKQGVELELLPLGVDVRLPQMKRDISARDMREQPPLIVTNGFLRRHKGVRTLIKAMPRVLEEFPGAKLRVQCAIYPSPDSEEEFVACKEAVEALGLKDSVVFDARFLEKAEVLDELSKADIAVLPYDRSNEGGSASATDAFAVGLPLIVSDAEIFDGVRHVAATVRPEAKELAELILEILGSKKRYEALVEASCGFAVKNSWENVGGYFLAVIFQKDAMGN